MRYIYIDKMWFIFWLLIFGQVNCNKGVTITWAKNGGICEALEAKQFTYVSATEVCLHGYTSTWLHKSQKSRLCKDVQFQSQILIILFDPTEVALGPLPRWLAEAPGVWPFWKGPVSWKLRAQVSTIAFWQRDVQFRFWGLDTHGKTSDVKGNIKLS